MWRRGWSGANPNVISPRGRGYNGGTNGRTALSGGRGSHDDSRRSNSGAGGGERSNYGLGGGDPGATGRGRGGTAYPGPESASSVGLHHTKAGEGEERGRQGGGGGFRNWKWEVI